MFICILLASFNITINFSIFPINKNNERPRKTYDVHYFC